MKDEVDLTNTINILFIADIIGKPGLDAVSAFIDELKREHKIDITIANGENAASGKGLSPRLAHTFFEMGINVITSGNHIWNRDKIYPLLEDNDQILRPLNYPVECPGHGSCIFTTTNSIRVGVINLQGRSFMYPIRCPFKTAEAEIRHLKSQGAKIIFVDFHAEATAEKLALAWNLDGKISALIGTHTHVQTADERILTQGTAYISDAGMTGPFDSVIGMEKAIAIQRFKTQMPVPYRIASEDPRLNGVIVSVNSGTGLAQSIKRVNLSMENAS
ncbi:TIGR00282 family metallophosphoesterase [bacterium]|nr:TIGR00282 family metallophosphoesterase [bacterium]